MSTTRIIARYYYNGVLTNPTTVKLSSADAAYGVKRQDTGAVVVADGTAMTQQSTGIYYYDITDPAYDLVYEHAVEIVYKGTTTYSVGYKQGTPSPTSTPAATESPVSLTYWDLVGTVQQFLGFGPRPYEQSSGVGGGDVAGGKDYERIRAIIDRAYMLFLNPPSVEKNGRQHVWSFLSPAATLTCVAGTYMYDLPADFGSMRSEFLTFADDISGNRVAPAPWDTIMRDRGDETPSNDYPFRYALLPKAFTPGTGQRWRIMLDPPPEDAYVLNYRYNVHPGAKLSASLCVGDGTIAADQKTLADADGSDFTVLGVAANDKIVIMDNNVTTAGRPIPSTYLVVGGTITAHGLEVFKGTGGAGDCRYEIYKANLYPLGGMDHAGTLMAACRAMAEVEEKGQPGPEYALFMQLLQASIRRDQQLLPSDLGYDGSRSTRLVRVFKKEWLYDGVPLT